MDKELLEVFSRYFTKGFFSLICYLLAIDWKILEIFDQTTRSRHLNRNYQSRNFQLKKKKLSCQKRNHKGFYFTRQMKGNYYFVGQIGRYGGIFRTLNLIFFFLLCFHLSQFYYVVIYYYYLFLNYQYHLEWVFIKLLSCLPIVFMN
jgi:hypothetical protein